MRSFPHYRQLDQMDCGPTCLRMVAKQYGRTYSLESLRQQSGLNRERVSLLGISKAAGKKAYTVPAEGSYVSGYCCSSCGTGGYSNATPC